MSIYATIHSMDVPQRASEDRDHILEVNETVAEIYACYSIQSLRMRLSINLCTNSYFRDALRKREEPDKTTRGNGMTVYLTLGELDEFIAGLQATRKMLADAIESEKRQMASSEEETS